MTNAEKLAKDTDFLANLIAEWDCSKSSCSDCPLEHSPCSYSLKERIKEWLESEAEDDERNHV